MPFHQMDWQASYDRGENATISDEYGGFPMSVVVTGFFVTSLAYLICFCCCIVQFFIRRGRDLSRLNNDPTASFDATNNPQKNDTLKKRFVKQFRYSLRKLQKKSNPVTSQSLPSDSIYGCCSICFEDYVGNPADIMVGLLKGCNHYYHFDCIWTWLEARGTCPLCREKVTLKESDVRGLSLRHIVDSRDFTPQTDMSHIDKDSDDDGTLNRPSSSSTSPAAADTSVGNVNSAFTRDDDVETGQRPEAVSPDFTTTTTMETETESTVTSADTPTHSKDLQRSTTRQTANQIEMTSIKKSSVAGPGTSATQSSGMTLSEQSLSRVTNPSCSSSSTSSIPTENKSSRGRLSGSAPAVNAEGGGDDNVMGTVIVKPKDIKEKVVFVQVHTGEVDT